MCPLYRLWSWHQYVGAAGLLQWGSLAAAGWDDPGASVQLPPASWAGLGWACWAVLGCAVLGWLGWAELAGDCSGRKEGGHQRSSCSAAVLQCCSAAVGRPTAHTAAAGWRLEDLILDFWDDGNLGVGNKGSFL